MNSWDYSYLVLLYNFPVFNSLSLIWSIGFVMVCYIFVQVMSGVIFSCNMTGVGLGSCYRSNMFIVTDVGGGWFIINTHSIVPSFIFMFIFFHVLSSLLYPIYYFSLAWGTGLLLYLLFIILGFTGYALVCGSMGFWATIVVCSLVNGIFGNVVGEMFFVDLHSITNSVVSKMFSYHFVLGIVCFLLVCFHVWLNHFIGSSSLCSHYSDQSSFFIYLLLSDLLVYWGSFFCYIYSICFYPEFFYSCDSYVEVDLFTVPDEINAEWYLSLFFIILKIIPNNVVGVVCMFLVFIVLFFKYFHNGVYGFSSNGMVFYFLIVFLSYDLIIISLYYFGGYLVSNMFVLVIIIFIIMIDLVEVVVLYIYFLIE